MTIPVFLRRLNALGKQAALAHPKCKLWAKVNHEDNFALAISSTIESAILDLILLRTDANDRNVIDWYNANVNKLGKMAMEIAREIYKDLHK